MIAILSTAMSCKHLEHGDKSLGPFIKKSATQTIREVSHKNAAVYT